MQEGKTYEKKYTTINNLQYVVKHITRNQKSLLLMMILLAIVSTISIYILPFVSKGIIDNVINGESLTKVFILIIILFSFQIMLTSVEEYLSLQVWWRTIRSRMNFETLRIDRFMSIKYEQLENQDMLDLAQKAACATEDNSSGIEGFLRSTQTALTDTFKMIVSIILISFLNPIIALIMFVFAYLGYWVTNRARKKDKELTWDVLPPFYRKRDYFRNVARDFSYAKDIRVYRMQNLILNREKIESNKVHNVMKASNNRWIFYSSIIQFILLLNEFVLYAWLINRVINYQLGIGNFSLYLVTLRTFFTTISSFLDSLSRMKKNSAEISDFREFIESSENSEEDCLPLPKKDEYHISFVNVSFKYPNQNDYILKNISFEIGFADRIAIVGSNGAGKSTIIKLLCRLYDVGEGEILLNGVNINKYKREECFSLFAPVFQDINLFAFSVAENVAMKKKQDINVDELQNSLEKSGASDIIRKLPQGSDTTLFKILDENGVDLSGGEKQKLATARSLYKNAPIVIFDEPTAALDPIAEKKFYETIDEKVGNKSVIYISHRLSSTKFCNTILFLANGEITERGSHEELIKRNGEYAMLYQMQAEYYQDVNVFNGGI